MADKTASAVGYSLTAIYLHWEGGAALIVAASIAGLYMVGLLMSVQRLKWFNWQARHFGVSTSRDRFDKSSGQITYDAKAKRGSAEVAIDLKFISTGVAPFDAHLRQADHLDVESHPLARFVSSEMRFVGDRLSEVAGQLTIRGITRPITLKARNFACYDSPFLKRELSAGDFDATVARSQYCMVHGLPVIVQMTRSTCKSRSKQFASDRHPMKKSRIDVSL